MTNKILSKVHNKFNKYEYEGIKVIDIPYMKEIIDFILKEASTEFLNILDNQIEKKLHSNSDINSDT